MDAAKLARLFEIEMASIQQAELRQSVADRVVALPVARPVKWDYGEAGQTFECWYLCEDAETNTAIVYCEQGFGPREPWGLINLEGPHATMGMDSQWFRNLEDAARNAAFWDGENPPGYEVR